MNDECGSTPDHITTNGVPCTLPAGHDGFHLGRLDGHEFGWPVERCEALRRFMIYGFQSGRNVYRRPINLETLLRCTRELGHPGAHRHRSVREWGEEYTTGWFDPPSHDDTSQEQAP